MDEQSVHLEIKCHSGRSEHLDIVLGGHSEGFETLLGRSKRGRFVEALFIAQACERKLCSEQKEVQPESGSPPWTSSKRDSS